MGIIGNYMYTQSKFVPIYLFFRKLYTRTVIYTKFFISNLYKIISLYKFTSFKELLRKLYTRTVIYISFYIKFIHDYQFIQVYLF